MNSQITQNPPHDRTGNLPKCGFQRLSTSFEMLPCHTKKEKVLSFQHVLFMRLSQENRANTGCSEPGKGVFHMVSWFCSRYASRITPSRNDHSLPHRRNRANHFLIVFVQPSSCFYIWRNENSTTDTIMFLDSHHD